ncbi:hypothetical protein EYF80_037400 [Liparis tanakae]|uniref:Uncharacterized protein n=1 Tax=Liparis tanakae TaxID=230148 RepID=A0A4Z2GFT1_9TELE|nr:hypothetical protein EYF80_037400 [Liparis tanakae]
MTQSTTMFSSTVKVPRVRAITATASCWLGVRIMKHSMSIKFSPHCKVFVSSLNVLLLPNKSVALVGKKGMPLRMSSSSAGTLFGKELLRKADKGFCREKPALKSTSLRGSS